MLWIYEINTNIVDKITNFETTNQNLKDFFWPIWSIFISLICLFIFIFLSENTLIGWKNCKNSGFLVLLLVVGSTEQDNLTNGTPGIARILLHNKVSGLKNLIWQFSLPTRIKSWYEFNTCFSRILNLQIYKKESWNFMFHFL